LAFLAATGCRIGEAAALDVPDYDPATGRAAITKTWSRDHGTRPPKSVHSRRTIVVPPPAEPAVAHAVGARKAGPLFRSKGKTRFDSAQIHIALQRQLAALGLPRPRNPHAIRHGVATLLVSKGVPLGDVAKYLGDTVETVVRTYVHPAGFDVAAELGAVLG
jgi:integrase